MDNKLGKGEREKISSEHHDDNDTTDIQDTHRRQPFTPPVTLPVIRIFNHNPTRSHKALPVKACSQCK